MWRTLLAPAALAAFAVSAQPKLAIENGWVRESPPGVRVNAAYLDIHNRGTKDLRLIAAHSPDFGAVEIHQTIVRRGTMGMRKQDSVPLPAGKTVSLMPGALHLMLFRPERAIREGGWVTLTLRFSTGDSRTLTLPVRRAWRQAP